MNPMRMRPFSPCKAAISRITLEVFLVQVHREPEEVQITTGEGNGVVLDITAVPGAGNLLGNLPCAVANLLNGVNVNLLGGALVNTLTTLLNNLVGALAGL
jgi:hypothetical protein